MTRLIDADALKKKLASIKLYDGVYCKAITEKDIDNAPTVEVGYLTNCANCERVEKIRAKRPHGKWIDTSDMEEYWAEEYRCSICGEKDHWHNFCPNCGAKMDGGEEE